MFWRDYWISSLNLDLKQLKSPKYVEQHKYLVDQNGVTVYHIAALHGYFYKESMHIKTFMNEDPLHFYAWNPKHFKKALKYIKELGLDLKNYYASFLKSGSPTALNTLWKDKKVRYPTLPGSIKPFQLFAFSGNYKDLKKEIIRNSNITKESDAKDNTIYHYLAHSGNYKALKQCIKDFNHILLEKNNEGATIFHYLALGGNYDSLFCAIKDYPSILKNVDNNGETIFHYLAKSGNINAVLRASRDPDIFHVNNVNGFSVLHVLADATGPRYFTEIFHRFCVNIPNKSEFIIKVMEQYVGAIDLDTCIELLNLHTSQMLKCFIIKDTITKHVQNNLNSLGPLIRRCKYVVKIPGIFTHITDFELNSITHIIDINELDFETRKRIDTPILKVIKRLGLNLEDLDIDNPKLNRDFLCPISRMLITDPVTTAAGTLYSRCNIEEWLKCNNTDPVTRTVLQSKQLNECFLIRKYIIEHLERDFVKT